MIPAIIAAAIAGISALKKMDDDKIQRRHDITAAEQKLWDERNARVQAKIDRMNGVDPSANAFDAAEKNLGRNIEQNPVHNDWLPLAKAVGTGASAIYNQANKSPLSTPNTSGPLKVSDFYDDSTPADRNAALAAGGRDVPGVNFSAAPGSGYTPEADLGHWQPLTQGSDNDADQHGGKSDDDEDDPVKRALRGYM